MQLPHLNWNEYKNAVNMGLLPENAILFPESQVLSLFNKNLTPSTNQYH